MPGRCSQCGFESSVEAAFIEHRRSFTRRNYKLCHACEQRRQSRRGRKDIVFLFGAAILGCGLVFINPGSEGGWLLINLAILDVMSVFTTFVHELGHALTAKALGMCVFLRNPTLMNTQLPSRR